MSTAEFCGLSQEQVGRFLKERGDVLEPIICGLAASAGPVNRSLMDALVKVMTAVESPIQAAFLTRSCNAVARLAESLPSESLGDAVSQPSDLWVLMRVLEDPGSLLALEKEDPLAKARLRGLASRERILKAEGGVMTVDQVALHLGISRQAVDKRRKAGKLLALAMGQHRFAYPAWQFTAEGVLSGLETVLTAFYEIDPWTQAAFFLSPNTLLEGTRPLDELRAGSVEPVRRAASALGEQSAA